MYIEAEDGNLVPREDQFLLKARLTNYAQGMLIADAIRIMKEPTMRMAA